jgi:aminoglycoside phosphotransferase (APT) family kinase protein
MTDITPALVSRLVATQFPQWADLPVTALELDGWDNTTFRLGEDMSVRLPTGDVYALQVDKEHQWLPMLASHLPLAIPEPLAKGVPGSGYPRPWSVYRWLEGDDATVGRITDLGDFATALAAFLRALHQIDPTGGPPPEEHNFFRGGPLAAYDVETRDAIGDPACDLAIAWTFFFGESREAFRAGLPFDDATWARGRGWTLWKALITLVRERQANRGEADLTRVRLGWRQSPRQVIDDVLGEHSNVA